MISVIVLTKDNESTIGKALDSTRSFDEVIVLDSGSTDKTESIARSYNNVKWYSHQFLGFGPMRSIAEKFAKHDWILTLDSDEALSSKLVADLKRLELDSSCVYSVPRHNYYKDKWIKWCGWYPNRQKRLYHKRKTGYTSSLVHEGVSLENMKEVCLKGPIYHYSYQNIDDFLIKMQLYTTLFAKENAGKKQASMAKALFHSSFAFFKSYFLKRGFLGGAEGLLISMYNGHTAFYKYLKLQEANFFKK